MISDISVQFLSECKKSEEVLCGGTFIALRVFSRYFGQWCSEQ